MRLGHTGWNNTSRPVFEAPGVSPRHSALPRRPISTLHLSIIQPLLCSSDILGTMLPRKRIIVFSRQRPERAPVHHLFRHAPVAGAGTASRQLEMPETTVSSIGTGATIYTRPKRGSSEWSNLLSIGPDTLSNTNMLATELLTNHHVSLPVTEKDTINAKLWGLQKQHTIPVSNKYGNTNALSTELLTNHYVSLPVTEEDIML
jgi:hypothetical protein